MPKVKKFKKITNKFIETGCYLGDGIQLAMDSGFEEIYSIELSDKFIKICQDRFQYNVNLIKGDSYTELSILLEKYPNDSFTYWLDGHYSGVGTGRGVKDFPIMEEIECILKRKISGEIIYVDDMRIIKNYNDSINTDRILDLIKKYKSDYKVYYEDSRLHNGEFLKDDILVIEY
jgi:hypothetical protein